MAPLRTTPYHDPSRFLASAVRVASSYGFSPLDALVEERKSGKQRRVAPYQPFGDYRRSIDPLSGEMLAAMKPCIENNAVGEGQPPALVYFSNLNRSDKRTPREIRFGLACIGSTKSVAEALVLRASLSLLEELGMRDTCVHINSMGDRDSLARLSRELTTYFRKHINTLPPQGQQALKRDVLAAFEFIHQKEHELCASVPRPMEFLTEDSRRHLRELIEYLETIGARYEIDDTLMGVRNCHSQTLMEIRGSAQEEGGAEDVYAWGGRFDEMPRIMFRTEMPSVGVLFTCKPKRSVSAKTLEQRSRKPQAFLVQLGFEAKLKCLLVLDTFRKEKISVEQDLNSDRLGEQLERAEALGVPYLIIVGHKEALEDTAIVRNMENRSQTVVALDELPNYLRAQLRAAHA